MDTSTNALPNSPTDLLQQLDAISDYPERHQHITGLACSHRNDPNLESLLDGLEAKGDVHSRAIAIQFAIVVGSGSGAGPEADQRRQRCEERLVRAVTSDSVLLAKSSAKPLGRTAHVDTLIRVLPNLSPKSRRRVLEGVVTRSAEDADRLFPIVRKTFGNRYAARLLKACSTDIVQENLAEMRYAIPSWKRLAIRHADIVVKDIQQRITAALADDGGGEAEVNEILAQVDEAFNTLVVSHAKDVIALAAQILDSGISLLRGIEQRLGKLALRVPEEVGELILHRKYRPQLVRRGLPRCLTMLNTRRLRLLSSEAHSEIARALVESPYNLATMLAALPPSARGKIFDEACAAIDTSERQWPNALLDVLPHRVRNAEAQRICNLPIVRKSSRNLLEMTAHCDIGDVRGELEEAARRSLAQDRAQGYSLLIACTGRYRYGLSDTIAFSALVKNDQDSVRYSVISSLRKLPLSLLASCTREDISRLRGLVSETLSAPDIGWDTQYCVEEFSHRLLLEGRIADESGGGELFQLGLDIVKLVLKQKGELNLPRFDQRLTQTKADAIYDAIEPKLLELARESREEHLVSSIAHSLGKYAWAIENLQDSLPNIAINSRNDWSASNAAGLWLEDPTMRDQRVRLLLDKDPTSIFFAPVLRHIFQYRQSFLDPYFENDLVEGRFDYKSSILCNSPVRFNFERWLPHQQRTYYQFLLKFINEPHALQEQARAVRMLAKLPVVRVDDLRQFLNVESVSVIEAALGGLPWLDRPAEALPILLEFLDGDRARVAMYAVPRCVNLLPAEQTMSLLQNLLSRERLKITVEKEVIRLLGGLSTAESCVLLSGAWNGGKSFHRDVKIAFSHASRQCLDHEEAWDILGDIATDEEAAVVRSILCMKPADCPGDAARKRFVTLILQVADHEDAEVRRDALASLVRWVSVAGEDIVDASVRAVLNFEDTVGWRGALSPLIAAIRAGKCSRALLALIESLRSAEVPLSHNAGKECDLPARRRLVEICNRLEDLGEVGRIRNVLRHVSDEVEKDSTLWETAAKLRLASVNWSERDAVASVFRDLSASLDEVPLRMTKIQDVIRAALNKNGSSWGVKDADMWLQALDPLDDGDSAGEAPTSICFVELAILVSTAKKSGWAPQWIDRLRVLRLHSDLGVRTAALDVNVRII